MTHALRTNLRSHFSPLCEVPPEQVAQTSVFGLRLYSPKNQKSQRQGDAVGFGSVHLRKNRRPQKRRSALRFPVHGFSHASYPRWQCAFLRRRWTFDTPADYHCIYLQESWVSAVVPAAIDRGLEKPTDRKALSVATNALPPYGLLVGFATWLSRFACTAGEYRSLVNSSPGTMVAIPLLSRTSPVRIVAAGTVKPADSG